jgi:hypothetical protein
MECLKTLRYVLHRRAQSGRNETRCRRWKEACMHGISRSETSRIAEISTASYVIDCGMRLDLGGMLDRALETNTVICPGQKRRPRKPADGSQSTLLARIRGGGRGTLDEVVGQNGGRWLQCLPLIGLGRHAPARWGCGRLGTLHQAPLTMMRRHSPHRGMAGQRRRAAGKLAAQAWR